MDKKIEKISNEISNFVRNKLKDIHVQSCDTEQEQALYAVTEIQEILMKEDILPVEAVNDIAKIVFEKYTINRKIFDDLEIFKDMSPYL